MKSFIKNQNQYIAKNEQTIRVVESEADILSLGGQTEINLQQPINTIISPMKYQGVLGEGHLYKGKMNIKDLQVYSIEVSS